VIWLNPLALAGVAAIVAPILIHILVRRRAPPFLFPTLRFLRPTRLAAIRRHVLEDLPLLLVRAAILTVAAVALAGPLLVTPARRATWNDRTARAVVGDTGSDAARRLPPSPSGGDSAARFNAAIETSDLRDGIARAIAWLEAAPPARRELVVVAPFVRGSISRADLDRVPSDVGIRLVRFGQPPPTRSIDGAPVLEAELSPFGIRQRDRTIELNGPSTSVHESAPLPATVPIEIVASADVKRAAEATLAAVLSQRVPAPVPGRTAQVVFDGGSSPPRSANAFARRKQEGAFAPWIADAIARVTTGEASTGGAARDGMVSAVAGPDGRTLVVSTKLPPADLNTAMLFRSIFDALATEDRSAIAAAADRSAIPVAADRRAISSQVGRSAEASAEREILTIPDADLRGWERAAGEGRSPRRDTIEQDDRQWWWTMALALLALEGWLRRSRRERVAAIDGMEAARVA
jgi:hypothetical protein